MEKISVSFKNNVLSGLSFSLLIILYVIINLLFGVVLNSFVKISGLLRQILSLCVPFLSIIIVLIFVKKYTKQKFTNLFHVEKFSFLSLLLCVILCVGMIFGFGYVNDAFISLLNKIGIKVSSNTLSMPTVRHYILFIFAYCLLPAVLEELVFRGVILFKLEGCGKIFACLISALCFSLYHLNFSQLIYQFIYGIFLGVLAIYSKSILPCIITHFLNNFLVLTFTYFNVNINLASPLIIAIGLAIIGAFLTITILKLKKTKTQTIESKSGFFIPFGVMGIIVSSVVILAGAFL